VQNYITAIVIFLIIEMLMTWLFYDYQNRNGSNAGSKVLMIVVAVLNAGRNSFSFFLLLIVCMGYGVVKPSLGKTMIYVRWLAAAHFVFGLIYSIASLTITPDSAGKKLSPHNQFLLLILIRTIGSFRDSTPCRNTHSFLRLDFELSTNDHERSYGAQADCQGWNVPKALVLHPVQYPRHIRLLFLQQFYFRWC
jgi:hypothetical protein